MKISKTLLIFLFFILPLIHGKLFETLGIPFGFSVSGNFEFTKVIFFNVLSGLILLSFFLESLYFKKNIYISPYVVIFIVVLISSTLFSLSPFHSLIGDTEKGHTALMYFNLLGLFFVLRNLKKPFLQKLVLASLFSGGLACIIAIKEYFIPSFDYGALGNRALGTFGHPNYLSGYLLLLLPFIIKTPHLGIHPRGLSLASQFTLSSPKGRGELQLFLAIFFITLILTKSLIALSLFLGYIIYKIIPFIPLPRGEFRGGQRKIFILIITLFFFAGSLGIIIFFFPEKLHSFLSRFYLWETTLKILFSDGKIFLFGGGAETLPYLFNSFKVPELYIFENFGYTADRPHNFFLNIFYHFGILGAGITLLLVYIFFRNFKNTPNQLVILLFLLYGIFHYFSVASYALIVLMFTLFPSSLAITQEKRVYFPDRKGGGRSVISISIILFLALTSITGAYFSIQLYRSEILYASGIVKQAQQIFSHPKYLRTIGEYSESQQREGLLSQNNIKSQIRNTPHKHKLCNTLTEKYPSAENFFFCGNIFEELGNDIIAKKFYSSGLNRLPDLWNKDSTYHNNYFVKQSVTGNRFFSPKFGNIPHILEYLEIENNFIK